MIGLPQSGNDSKHCWDKTRNSRQYIVCCHFMINLAHSQLQIFAYASITIFTLAFRIWYSMPCKVLALNENREHGRALRKALTDKGHSVTVVHTREAALRELLEEDYDIVISALHFQTESAFDFLRTVKTADSLQDKPFIFCCMRPSELTKTIAEGLEVTARALGAERLLLVDTYNDAALERALREVCTQRDHEDEHA